MLAIFVLFLCVFAIVFSVRTRLAAVSKGAKRGSAEAACFFSLVFVCALFVFSHTMVKTNHAGIVNVFGRNLPDRYYPSGFHFKAPWEKVIPVDLAYSNMEFAGQNSGGLVSALTKDGIIVGVPFSVSWAVDPRSVATVKSKLPDDGVYDEAIRVVGRSAVRDAVGRMTLADTADHVALARAMANEIILGTTSYFDAQGYDSPDQVIRYGALSLRGVFPPTAINAARNAEIAAEHEAAAAGIRSQIPAGRSVRDYTAAMSAQTARAAVDNGNPVTVVMGDAPAVAIAGGKGR